MTFQSVIEPCDRYDRAIGVLVPGRDSDDARLMRRRLMKSRDIASQALGASCASDDVRGLYRTALHVASEHCFAHCPDDTLRDAANLCVRLFQAAAALERLEASHGAH